MPRKKKIPSYGRSYGDISKDYHQLRSVSHDVPLGNTDPTVVQGAMYGGMPNASRRARGRLKTQRGRNM